MVIWHACQLSTSGVSNMHMHLIQEVVPAQWAGPVPHRARATSASAHTQDMADVERHDLSTDMATHEPFEKLICKCADIDLCYRNTCKWNLRSAVFTGENIRPSIERLQKPGMLNTCVVLCLGPSTSLCVLPRAITEERNRKGPNFNGQTNVWHVLIMDSVQHVTDRSHVT